MKAAFWIKLYGLALALAFAGPAAAAETLTQDLAVGEVEFNISCASCHGTDGTGKGAVAPFLKVRPTDLTGLALKNNGIYPAEAVMKTIDGRNEVAVHGKRVMPVWGTRYLIEFEMFGGEQNDKALVAGRIARLARYIETLQRQR